MSARIAQLVTAPAGWFSVHADHPLDGSLDLDAPVDELVTLRPVAAFAVRDDWTREEPVETIEAVVALDGFYGGVPSVLTAEDANHEPDFVGYLAPGVDLELFRGAILDRYTERIRTRSKAMAA